MNFKIKRINKGIYFALLTSVVSGVSIFINSFAVKSIQPPLVFTTTKNIGVGLLIILFLLVTSKWKKLADLTRKEVAHLLLIAVLGGAIPFYLFFTGLSQIPAINGALIHKTLILWVAFLAYPFLKEKISKPQAFAIMLIFTGNIFVGGFKGFTFSQGELFVLLATIFWAVENILAKKVLKNVDPDILTGSRMFLGSLILVAASLITAPNAFGTIAQLNQTQWIWLSLTVVSLLAYVMTWYRALKLAPAVTVATVLVSSTLITNMLSAVFVTNTWNSTMVIQTGLILFGVAVAIYSYKRETASMTLEVQ